MLQENRAGGGDGQGAEEKALMLCDSSHSGHLDSFFFVRKHDQHQETQGESHYSRSPSNRWDKQGSNSGLSPDLHARKTG